MAVEITRTDMSASELRTTAARTKDAKAARRMLAIALVLDGTDRRTAAEACGMDRQTLRDWVHRYNADGIAGLSNRYAAGPTPLLNPEQKVELARMVREGPDLEADGVVRWRCVDLKRLLGERFGRRSVGSAAWARSQGARLLAHQRRSQRRARCPPRQCVSLSLTKNAGFQIYCVFGRPRRADGRRGDLGRAIPRNGAVDPEERSLRTQGCSRGSDGWA